MHRPEPVKATRTRVNRAFVLILDAGRDEKVPKHRVHDGDSEQNDPNQLMLRHRPSIGRGLLSGSTEEAPSRKNAIPSTRATRGFEAVFMTKN